MNTPPPLPIPAGTKTFYHHAATASLFALPLAIVVNILGSSSAAQLDAESKRSVGLVVACFASLILLVGVVAGIVALFGIPRYGRKGILAKALFGSVLPVVLMALALPAVMNAKARAVQLQQKAVESHLTTLADQINRQGPKMIDEETSLESAEALPNRVIVYQYKMVNATHAEIVADGLVKIIRPNLLALYKTSPDMKIFRSNGVTVIYRYKDKTGEAIGEVKVGPEDLK